MIHNNLKEFQMSFIYHTKNRKVNFKFLYLFAVDFTLQSNFRFIINIFFRIRATCHKTRFFKVKQTCCVTKGEKKLILEKQHTSCELVPLYTYVKNVKGKKLRGVYGFFSFFTIINLG